MDSSIYKKIIQRITPPKTLYMRMLDEPFGLKDCLEDVAFRDWLLESVGDDQIVVKDADMLLIPGLESLAIAWARQSADYNWAIATYPEIVDRLATIGMALEYKPAGETV